MPDRIILDGDSKGEHLWLDHHGDGTVTLGMYMIQNISAPAQQTTWFDKHLVTIRKSILLKALNNAN